MRVFKWSTDFRCSAESPIVPVWVSLPYLPVHFIHCKYALCSIASAIDIPLRVDHATTSVNRPSVARVLVEYDVSKPLLPRIWIGEGDSGFWQDVVFERVPAYCNSCKHLGHSVESCYIANPELRKAQIADAAQDRDKGRMKKSDTVIQPKKPNTTQYVVTSDHRTQGPSTQPPVDLTQGPPHDESRPVGTSAPGAPLDPSVSHSGDVTTILGDILGHIADHAQVGFNSHSTDIPDFDDGDENRRLGLFHVGYFRGLLYGDTGQFQQTDFDTIPTLVTTEDDVDLCREPDIDDVRRAIFSIDPESAPGPDGFCSRFYQFCWDIIGRDLLDVVLDYFRGSAMPRGFQSTLLVLLPKKESPSSWADFRPISLCNVSNKVITKLLVQRLSPILPQIISPT